MPNFNNQNIKVDLTPEWINITIGDGTYGLPREMFNAMLDGNLKSKEFLLFNMAVRASLSNVDKADDNGIKNALESAPFKF